MKLKKLIDVDLFPIVLILISIFTSYHTWLIWESDTYNINSGTMFYISIITLTISLSDTIVALIDLNDKIDSGSRKKFSLFLSVMFILILLSILLFLKIEISDVLEKIRSFSQRGGFTGISVTLLILKIAEINYSSAVLAAKENKDEINRLRKENEELRLKEKIREKNEEYEKKKKTYNEIKGKY